MKIQNSIKAACAALLFGLASQASAGVISVNASGVSGYLNNNTYNGVFNAGSLPGQFTINSIGFSFTFADDADDTFTSVPGQPGTSTTSDILGSGNNLKIVYTTTTTTDVTRKGEQESVKLSFGSFVFDGQTAPNKSDPVKDTQTGAEEPGATVSTKNAGKTICTLAEATAKNSKCKDTATATVAQTVTNTTTYYYDGNFEISQFQLTYEALLNELMSTRSLNFSLGVTGDLNLLGATLNIDYTDTTPPAPVNNVPEPASLALFGIALAGIAGIRRTRRD